VLMIAFVGAAMLAMGTTISIDAKRTLRQSNEAQLDQLLLAGIAETTVHLSTSVPTAGASWNTALPASLAAAPASLKTTVVSTDDMQTTLRISATYIDISGSEIARFRHDSDGWKLISAEIE